MSESVMLALEDIAYLAGRCESVADRRRLDLLLQETSTFVGRSDEEGEVRAA